MKTVGPFMECSGRHEDCSGGSQPLGKRDATRYDSAMKLLLIRHAIAEEREDFARTGKDDRLRPLTDEGRKRMKQAARGLLETLPEIDLLATSPLTRAAQTGAIVDSVYGGLKEV